MHTKKVEQYLSELENFDLIRRYNVDGNTYLFAPRFEKHQVGLQKNKEAQSQIPPPPPELLQSSDRTSPPQVEVKAKAKVKEVVGGDNNNLQKELLKLKGWGPTHLEEDKAWLAEFLEEYPGFNESYIKACRDYHSSKSNHNKALWKTRLRNWMKKEREIQKKGSQYGTHRGHTTKLPPRNEYTKPPPDPRLDRLVEQQRADNQVIGRDESG